MYPTVLNPSQHMVESCDPSRLSNQGRGRAARAPSPTDLTKSCIQSRFVQQVSWSQHGLYFAAPIKSGQSFVETAVWAN